MAKLTLTALTFTVWTVQLLLSGVECSNWAWEKERDYYQPMHRRSRVPHVGVRRSIFDRFWGETTPNNPFLPTSPAATQFIPRLSENDFILRGDDYDDYLGDPHWFPQRLPQATHRTQSLEELEHFLEGETDNFHDPLNARQHHSSVPSVSHKLDKEKKQRGKHRKHQQTRKQEGIQSSPSSFSPFSSPSSFSSSASSDRSPTLLETSQGFGHHPDYRGDVFSHDSSIGPDLVSEDIISDFQEHTSMPERFTNNKQFPKNALNTGEMLREFRHEESLPNEHLSSSPFAIDLQSSYPFQEQSMLNPSDLNNPDQGIDGIDLSKILNLGILGKFAHSDMSNSQSPDIPESAIGENGWLLNLPSHNQMTEQQNEKDQRGIRIIRSSMSYTDACHARNLDSCGSRVSEEFAVGPNSAEKCRIREEFLDCMEQEMKRPCNLNGDDYSRDRAKRIRDRIKNLLRSAEGCILGYST